MAALHPKIAPRPMPVTVTPIRTAPRAQQPRAVRRAESRQDFGRCVQIRTRVLVLEQGWSAAAEVDAHESECTHYLAFRAGEAVGTVRWRPVKPGVAKIERLAVLAEARGQGAGRALLACVVAELERHATLRKATLCAPEGQHAALYAALGFAPAGPPVREGGLVLHPLARDV